LSPIQKLTPEADGNYYHTVQSGETLSWIAGLYSVPLEDLMAWNGLNNSSVIRPEQKLLLRVTPPVTSTPTPTITPSSVAVSPSPSMTQPAPTETPSIIEAKPTPRMGLGLVLGVTAIVLGGLIWLGFSRKSVKTDQTEE
jgi:hypothetical protein